MTQDTLFQQLKHPNPNLRDRAMWEIVDTRDETTIPKLMGILADEDVVYRRAAVKTLGAIGADTAPLVVESLLNSDNVTIRGSCAKALAQIAVNYREEPFPVEGLEGLKKSLHDPNPVVHIASVMALGEVGPPAFDILVEALNTTDNVALAVAIANALASIGDDRAKAVLTELVNDESVDIYVKETATSALSRLELIMKNQPK
ncbi:MAG: HEAT repeat domain-containing protein [Calothrix sp. MO_192.B10]|nr:HEAT repeat domain-containing protein [Calothrix sp. MO_192.B10]